MDLLAILVLCAAVLIVSRVGARASGTTRTRLYWAAVSLAIATLTVAGWSIARMVADHRRASETAVPEGVP
jgi:hypothetical protein